MNGWEFVASVIGDVVWPVTLLIILFFARDHLHDLAARLSMLRYKDVQIDFGRGLTSVEEKVLDEAKRIEPEVSLNKELNVPAAEQPTFYESFDRAKRLAQLSPSAAIMEAWVEIEGMLSTMARHHGIESARVMSPINLIKLMRSREIIDSNTAAILNDLRALRNNAAHSNYGSISTDDALRFQSLAKDVVKILAASAD